MDKESHLVLRTFGIIKYRYTPAVRFDRVVVKEERVTGERHKNLNDPLSYFMSLQS